MNRDYAGQRYAAPVSGPRLLLGWTLGTLWGMALPLVLLALLVAFVVFFGQRFGFFGDEISLPGTSLANLAADDAREVELFTLLPKDGIPSIDDPDFLPGRDAALPSGLPVIGVAVGSDARAYPLPVLASHEIVNDTVGGLPVAVTYCPLCLTEIVFERQIDGKVVEFGVSGKLLMNDLVMYDRDTDSLWSQILGEGLTGTHRGRTLTAVESLQTTWGIWSQLHPTSLVLDNTIRADSYASYYVSGDSGVHGDFVDDDRLPDKAVVVGVVVNGEPRAYPIALSREEPLINDVLGGEAILTAFVPDGATGVVYRRLLATAPAGAGVAPGTVLRFTTETPESFTMTDVETGSVWNRLTGEAESGPLAGARLERLPATTSFWFGWRDFFPRTSVHGVDAEFGGGE